MTSTATDGWHFRPLPWQQEAWRQLGAAVAGGSAAHALLLHGRAGTGKRQLAEALVARLLCHAPGADIACGECRACGLLRAGSHSDLLLVQPEGDSRFIKIEQVRALIDFAARTPALGTAKVILLHPAEAMNSNAANALLKCLEEPAPGTFLLLVSHVPSRLPATVRSRCQQWGLGDPAAAESLDWLAREIGDPALAGECLALADGRPLAALALATGEQLEQQRALRAALQAIASGKLGALDFSPLVADQALDEVLAQLVAYTRAILRQRALDNELLQRPQFDLLEELERLHRASLGGANPNRQMTIETCVAQMARVLGPLAS